MTFTRLLLRRVRVRRRRGALCSLLLHAFTTHGLAREFLDFPHSLLLRVPCGRSGFHGVDALGLVGVGGSLPGGIPSDGCNSCLYHIYIDRQYGYLMYLPDPYIIVITKSSSSQDRACVTTGQVGTSYQEYQDPYESSRPAGTGTDNVGTLYPHHPGNVCIEYTAKKDQRTSPSPLTYCCKGKFVSNERIWQLGTGGLFLFDG